MNLTISGISGSSAEWFALIALVAAIVAVLVTYFASPESGGLVNVPDDKVMIDSESGVIEAQRRIQTVLQQQSAAARESHVIKTVAAVKDVDERILDEPMPGVRAIHLE